MIVLLPLSLALVLILVFVAVRFWWLTVPAAAVLVLWFGVKGGASTHDVVIVSAVFVFIAVVLGGVAWFGRLVTGRGRE